MFDVILDRIIAQCPGSISAMIMGFDGISLEQVAVAGADMDLTLMGVELSRVATEIRNTGEILEAGKVQEISFKSEKYLTVIRLLTDEYFIALVITAQGNYGKARYLLMREAPALINALV